MFELNQTLPNINMDMSLLDKHSWESFEEDYNKRFNLWLIQCAVAESPKKTHENVF